MPLPTRPARPTALPVTLLLATALMTAGLTSCSALSPFNTCDDTAVRLKDLRSQSILNSTPEGATALRGLDSVDSRCIDDTGDAWLYAARVYAFPGSRQEVVDFYRTTAKADGWRLQHDPSDPDTPETTAGLCFTKGGDGDALLLSVQFTTARDLKFEYDYDAGPEFDLGSGFEIEVGSETDGAKVGCFD
ncbi:MULTISPECIES: hypothetical protein [Streptomyces]|uniref:Lipoprotein n=1 Tax=Streptomyces dengpaensis TaxID=2049881 RepID=A0ABN5I2E1_9ACTN|nr:MULTISPECIES: hypothetical protein [Streptomyces]AVH55877.1 hypothetical protein C4B68_08945 [Streptomyces dengpaensis]PIB12128.1 hypothetical protein B1C81_02880 [Streptomyces sp. HG99]